MASGDAACESGPDRTRDTLIFGCFVGMLGLLYTAGAQHQREFHSPAAVATAADDWLTAPPPPPPLLETTMRRKPPPTNIVEWRTGEHPLPTTAATALPGAYKEEMQRTVELFAAAAAPSVQKETFTLVNSFWEDSNQNQRYKEILGAMRANIMNKGLAELVVMYETGADDKDKACRDLEALLTAPLDDLKLPHAVVTCVSRPKGQPTYENLFEYSNTQPDQPFKGSVVVVANGDVVLDDTIEQLPHFVGHVAYALTVNSNINAGVFQTAAGFKPCPKKRGSKVKNMRCPFFGTDKNGPKALSYDGFAFKPPLPASFAAKARAHKIGLDEVMNKLGMENRAKCALEAAGVLVLSSCIWVRLQHYHTCGGYSHNNKFVPFHPDFGCSRALYPCMLRNSGNIPKGSNDSSKVVATGFCDKVAAENLVPHVVVEW